MEHLLETYARLSSDFEAVMRGDKNMTDDELLILIKGISDMMRIASLFRALEKEGTLGV